MQLNSNVNYVAIVQVFVVFSAVKMLTPLVIIQNTIINDSNYVTDKLNSTDVVEVQLLSDQKVVLDYFIEYLYFIFIKNW